MAIRHIPLGTAYAVRVEIDAALTLAGTWSPAAAPNIQAILVKLTHDTGPLRSRDFGLFAHV